MNVYLTFDVEVWCNDWERLDERFPASFERYVFGRSRQGDYALPMTLDIMARHGVRGVFFVEPLFSARFGSRHLETIVDLIGSRGHSIQLHLHPEWTDEISPPPLPDVTGKRQHLIFYSEEEQTALIALGKRLLEQAGAPAPRVFRAGSFAANAATFRALARNGIRADSSLNECFAYSGADLRVSHPWAGAPRTTIGEVTTYPVTVFRDGLGRLRPAQVTACALDEFAAALASAALGGASDFVIVSHNFELLKPGSSRPDPVVVRRFDALCRLLAANDGRWRIATDMLAGSAPCGIAPPIRARAPLGATLYRYAEQALRRLI